MVTVVSFSFYNREAGHLCARRAQGLCALNDSVPRHSTHYSVPLAAADAITSSKDGYRAFHDARSVRLFASAMCRAQKAQRFYAIKFNDLPRKMADLLRLFFHQPIQELPAGKTKRTHVCTTQQQGKLASMNKRRTLPSIPDLPAAACLPRTTIFQAQPSASPQANHTLYHTTHHIFA